MHSQLDQPDATVVLNESPVEGKTDDAQCVIPAKSVETSIHQILLFLVLVEMTIVKKLVAGADRYRVRFLSNFISRLGNGWIYAAIPFISIDDIKNKKYWVFVVSAVNAAIVHAIYPFIKAFAARVRPFQADASLKSEHAPKDLYSFPSGHTMTLTAVLTPIIYVTPQLSLAGATVICAMCWARMASAHHYLTDVLTGVLLGGMVGYPISYFCLIR